MKQVAHSKAGCSLGVGLANAKHRTFLPLPGTELGHPSPSPLVY
jgi:hypothetical protein